MAFSYPWRDHPLSTLNGPPKLVTLCSSPLALWILVKSGLTRVHAFDLRRLDDKIVPSKENFTLSRSFHSFDVDSSVD